MTYNVTVKEQIWYLTTYQVEANNKEEAEELVYENGELIDQEELEISDYDIVKVEEA